ncbi:protein KRI1 homolog [Phlebotomus argentipes]|uniref:protein KRI1 homolog n=1 Tax=Phlebotomus argentipes TaxID=94469 RepID=UPI0028934F8F|nr:protein KRI1 homolog [Phlebotomus argentipes]
MSDTVKKMFDSDSDLEPEDLNFSTNKKFAKSYDQSRRKELLKKLKSQDLESDESSSSSEESEEDNGFEDEEFDKTFFSTLASIKARDPKIYQKNVEFFGEVDLSTRKRSKEDKPITIRDLERKVLLEHGGMFEETDDKGKRSLPVVTEEEKEDKKLFQQFYSDSDGEEGGAESLFVAKKVEEVAKKPAEKKVNEEIVKPISVFWNDSNISKEEAYLRDYILKRRFKDDGEDGDAGNLTEDEEDLEKQAEFEKKVNFRFEENDQDFIKRFPRTIATSVRNVDDKRKKKRAEVKERKTREKEERKKELEKLKELKRKEIEEKISKLKQVAGSERIAFEDADLSDDFDPEEHDRKMQEIFNDEYYGVDEGEDKPECPDIEDLKVIDWDNYDPAEDEVDVDPSAPHCDDPDFNMDCEYDPKEAKKNFEQEMIENSKSKKRRKRRSKFAEVLRKDKPVFNPEDEKTYSEYIDEYYKMDCEDVIGDVKCRFKYVETVPNDFGLSVEEILMAKNKELNKWASLKKAVQIRPKHVEMNEVKQYERRRENWHIKKNILKSVYGEESENEEEDKNTPITVIKLTGSGKKVESEGKPRENPKESKEEAEKSVEKKKKKKPKNVKMEVVEKKTKKKQQKKIDAKPQENAKPRITKRKAEENQKEPQNPHKKFKFSEKKKAKSQVIDYETAQGKFSINENRLMAFGINPKKFRSKVKYGSAEQGNSKAQQSKSKKKNRKAK